MRVAVKVFYKRNGKLVVGNELILSKPMDVEMECVSERKEGKEGHVTGYITLSLRSVVFGIQLRLKGGIQESNVITLLGYLPKLINIPQIDHTRFDRCYNRNSLLSQFCQKKKTLCLMLVHGIPLY